MFVTLNRANTASENSEISIGIYKIVAFYPDGDVTAILTDAGVVYSVTETFEQVAALIAAADEELA